MPTPSPPTALPRARPINLRPWEARAFVDGAKVQIRRPINPKPPIDESLSFGEYHPLVSDRDGNARPGYARFGAWTEDGEWALPCPFGRPGDRLYGREAFWEDSRESLHGMNPSIIYAASPEWCRDKLNGVGRCSYMTTDHRDPGIVTRAQSQARLDERLFWSKKSSIRMPRWATRHHFTITALRAERVQAISEADALAEGIRLLNGRYTFNDGLHESRDPVASYRAAWDSMYGHGAAERDDYVWAMTLERISA